MLGRDVSILLQDYAQELLVPLPGALLVVGDPEPIGESPAGAAFLHECRQRLHRGLR